MLVLSKILLMSILLLSFCCNSNSLLRKTLSKQSNTVSNTIKSNLQRLDNSYGNSYKSNNRKMMMSNSLRVTTYNVLSNHLAAPNYFTSCQPQYLDGNYRLNKLKQKLTTEMEKEAIVCLQEISTSWAGQLHTFFSKNNYYLVTGLYGNKFNGYMGIGIAVPLQKYNIINVDITRIADTKYLPRKPSPGLTVKILLKFKNLFFQIGKLLGFFKDNYDDLWENVTYKTNQMISIRLQPKTITNTVEDTVETIEKSVEKSVDNSISTDTVEKIDNNSNNTFVIGTYHMPCMFKLPSVMVSHCALSAQHLHKFANGDPYLFLGDFNIKPDSIMYKLMTTGDISKTVH